MEDSPVVEIEDLYFAYDGVTALENVTLTVRRNEFLCVVGPNGGGKTTLLKLILGLLRPSRGSIRVFGVAPEEGRSRIGYVPQQSNVDPKFPVSAMDVVLMGRLGKGNLFTPYRRDDRQTAEAALEAVGLHDAGRRPFSALSGGQQQRVLIARALAGDPDLLLLDEPTANLDLHVEGEFYTLLRRLNERMTIILVSHDIGFVSQMIDRVVCVKKSVVVHPTSELTGEMIHEVYGGEVRMVRHDH